MRVPCEHCGGSGYREIAVNELTKNGQIVGLVEGAKIVGWRYEFDEVLVKGDWRGLLSYDNHNLIIVAVREQIGLEIGMQGARGPLLKGVVCDVVAV